MALAIFNFLWRWMNISFQELRINRQIRAEEVRVIDESGASLGVYKIDDALKLADEKNTDLVEMSPNAKPPVCKLIDYGKYRFAQTKKDKQNRKNQHVIVVKEIQVRPNIDPHDLEIKIKHALEFLDKQFKVRFALRFRGRELEYRAVRGPEISKKIIAAVSEKGEVETPPTSEDREIVFTIQPRKK
jgi:translation initiation factor IF-3